MGLTTRVPAHDMTRGDLFRSMKDALYAVPKGSDATVLDHLVRSGLVSASVVDALGLQSKTFTARDIADHYTASVVQLEMYRNETFQQTGKPNGHASAFFISEDGLAVTNYHSIRGFKLGEAVTLDGTHFEIKNVLGYDDASDFAVIRISTTSMDGKEQAVFHPMPFTSADDVCPGDQVFAIGNPLGQGLAVSEGIISAVNRKVSNYEIPLILNTADISTGSSGGALLNIYGHVVGITMGAYNTGNSLFLSVPIDVIRTVDLSSTGKTLAEVEAEWQAMVDAEENAEPTPVQK